MNARTLLMAGATVAVIGGPACESDGNQARKAPLPGKAGVTIKADAVGGIRVDPKQDEAGEYPEFYGDESPVPDDDPAAEAGEEHDEDDDEEYDEDYDEDYEEDYEDAAEAPAAAPDGESDPDEGAPPEPPAEDDVEAVREGDDRDGLDDPRSAD